MESSQYEEFMKTQPYEPFLMGGRLTEAMKVKARKELGETEETKARKIPELRKLIQDEPGLHCPTDDAYLLQYLRARKFNVKKAFSVLKNYYEIKKSNPDLYGSFNLESMKTAIGHKAGFFMPYRDLDGCAVGMIRMKNWDIDITNVEDAITAFTMGALYGINEPATQVCGVRFLIDVEGTTWRQIRSVIPRHAYLIARAFMNCLPVRIKGFHIFNESPIFRPLISFIKLFVTEKIRKRLVLHGDSQEHLHKYIPKAILPAEVFGGDNPNDITDWFNCEVEKFCETFHQLTTYGYKN